MKRHILITVGILALTLPCVLAGDIRGRITTPVVQEAGFVSPSTSTPAAPPPLDVVVWVDGVQNFTLPATAPTLSVKGLQITPSLAVAVVGQMVTIPNLDRVAHSLFSFSEAKRFDLGAFSKGETRGILFDKPGVVDIYCSIHRSMRARVVVVPSPFFTRTSLNGDYEIPGVPAGKYVLVVWNERFHSQPREIFVSETGEVRADLTLLK